MAIYKITLTTSDLLPESRDTPFGLITLNDFNGTSLPKWLRDKAQVIKFTGKDGGTKTLKYDF